MKARSAVVAGTRVAAFALGALVLALVAAAGQDAPPPAGIADRDLGLSRTSVFAAPAPPAVIDNESAPGEAPVLPRAYPGAPPRVPHGIAALLPITRRDNFCVDCHLIDEKVEGGPTPIPASHQTDLRRAPGEVGGKVVGARWVCVSCHAPVTGAPPLVGNGFASAPAAPIPPPEPSPPG
jgi:cytochrome c-type protein NapB